jgi:hypothetical protein
MGNGLPSDLAQPERLRPTPAESSWLPLARRARRAVGPLVERLAWTMLWGPRAERAPLAYPPGHYYSPIPARRDIEGSAPVEIVGIDLRCDEQLATLKELDLHEATGARYDAPDNGWFPPTDAAVYQAMIRHYQPARVIEVGCGWSTAALFDAGAAPHVTLIEPYPDRLLELLSPDDLARCEVFEAPLQDVPLSVFRGLGAGDVLFIDSTHVTKCGSDVNRIFFEILPALAPGVIIHFHDVFYPFEYPGAWTREGRGWNEVYLLRAFLEYNDAFEIVLWNSMLQEMGHLSGDCGSIWLRKVLEPGSGFLEVVA